MVRILVDSSRKVASYRTEAPLIRTRRASQLVGVITGASTCSSDDVSYSVKMCVLRLEEENEAYLTLRYVLCLKEETEA